MKFSSKLSPDHYITSTTVTPNGRRRHW